MKWEGREESSNVEDRRGMGPVGMAVGGGGSVLLLILGLLFGFDPSQMGDIFGPAPAQRTERGEPRSVDPAEERLARFTKVVLRDTEVVWGDLFKRAGQTYREPSLVMFDGAVDSACGMAESAVGPFYCPPDRRVYIDLAFFRDMERKLNSPGEFARAYVITHEVGHHVQNLLGFSQRMDQMRRRVARVEANRMSVRLELQADYLAGVWAHHAQKRFNFMEAGDVDSALNAAFQIGDDRLQRKSRGRVVPDSFTHGTSQQRMAAFTGGLQSGDMAGAASYTDQNFAVR